jgi:hypothetical protein
MAEGRAAPRIGAEVIQPVSSVMSMTMLGLLSAAWASAAVINEASINAATSDTCRAF